jgi:preprotein translocase subunit SecA
VIYGKRRHALFGERLSLDIQNSLFDLCEELATKYHAAKDFEAFELEVIKYFGIEPPMEKAVFDKSNTGTITEDLFEAVLNAYKNKKEEILAMAMPVLQAIHRDRGTSVANVAIPFSEGKKGMNVVVPLNEIVETEGKDLWKYFEKNVSLAYIDEAWKHHLRMMDDLKQEVQTAHFEQKDPLVIYKIESFNLFKTLLTQINGGIASFLFKGELPNQEQSQREVREAKIKQTDLSKMQTNKAEVDAQGNPGDVPAPERRPEPVVRTELKIGRNDPCPCGSGKKFKQCHGKDAV